MVYNYAEIFGSLVYVSGSGSETTTGGNVSINYASTWDGTTGTGGWSTMDGGISSGFSRGLKIYSSNRIYIYMEHLAV